MPFISTKTNVTVTKEKETQLKERLGQAISIIPGKSESWLMLAIEGDILGVAPDHMYIRYFGSEDWRWNGSNF